jgi:hypothetical protein
MNEHIIPSLSHILGSNATTQLILNDPELLDEKIVVPFISQPYTSVDEYVDGHVYDFEKDKKVYGDLGVSLNKESYKFQLFEIYPARQSIDQKPIDELIKLKRDFLANHIKVATTYDPRNTEAVVFQQGLLRDYNPRTSPFKEELIKYQKFAESLAQILQDYFSQRQGIDRFLVLKLIEKNVREKQHRSVFFKILMSDYYLGGSSQLDSMLSVERPFVDIYKKKFEGSVLPLYSSVQTSEIKGRVFTKFLDVMNIKVDVLDRLDIDGLLSVRKDRATKKFRERYQRIVEQKTKGIPLSSDVCDVEDIEKEVVEAIESEASEQKPLLDKLEITKKTISAVSYSSLLVSLFASTFSFIPYITIPAAVAGIVGKIKIVDPLLTRYEENKCNFILVSEKIRKKAI